MMDERERNRQERLGIIEPEPIAPPAMHSDEREPLPAVVIEPMEELPPDVPEPLCPQCHRPYDISSPLLKQCMAEPWYCGGCQHCSPLGFGRNEPIYLSGPKRKSY